MRMSPEGFRWGVKVGVGKNNSNFKFYESFSCDGVDYFVYDSVYLYTPDDPEPSIAKIVKLFETPRGDKKVKLLWFFRPSQVRNFLGTYQPKWNEIFLGSGRGVGLTNLNPLEVISQKCNVVCTSKDGRNPQPSQEELRMAEYSFCCTYDVGEHKILNKFPDEIDGIKVENLFNKKKIRKLSHHLSGNSSTNNLVKDPNYNDTKCNLVKDQKPISKVPIVEESVGSKRMQGDYLNERTKVASESPSQDKRSRNATSSIEGADRRSIRVKFFLGSQPANASNDQCNQKRKLLHDEDKNKVPKIAVHQPVENWGSKTAEKHIEDKSKWFHKLPWEKRMKVADEDGTLVLLYNLDPSFTSSEVEDLVCQAFNEKVDAKTIQQNSYSSPNCGQALVIFKSEKAAASALDKLKKGCLMLADGRPVTGTRGKPPFPGNLSTFVGHLDLGIVFANKPRKSESLKKAVSTAHCAHPNSIENDLALEWLMLQDQSDMSWHELYRQQRKEIEDLKNQLKLTWAKLTVSGNIKCFCKCNIMNFHADIPYFPFSALSSPLKYSCYYYCISILQELVLFSSELACKCKGIVHDL